MQDKEQNENLEKDIKEDDKDVEGANEEQKEEKIEHLSPEEIIENLKSEIEQLKDQKLRTIAELENFRKRSEKEHSDALKYGIANFAKDVISIRDNIERANASIDNDLKGNEKIKPIIEGIELIHQSVIGVLDRFSIKKINCINEKFDHNFHQAMMEIENEDCDPGTVVQELIPGYTLHDRLLRPAMVGVSKQKTEKTSKSEEKPS
jgi:molecular chaperone GrpE